LALARGRRRCQWWTAALLTVVAAPAGAEVIRLAVISESASSWPLYVAQARGLFEEAGVTVTLTVTRSSSAQLRGLEGGDFDVGHQAADHVIRSVEGGSDLFIVMGLNRPAQTIVAGPAIAAFRDLKGKLLAVDDAASGYALLLKRILARHGLKEGDYRLSAVGGSNERYEAVRSGAVAAALLSPPHDLKLLAEGFKSLGNTTDDFPAYLGSVAAARRSWAASHEDALVRYIRAYVAASDWLFDPAHREEALAILAARVKVDRAQASATYEAVTSKSLIPRAAVDQAGLEQVIEVCWDAGRRPPPRPPADRYVDLRYREKALVRPLTGP
jgi:ABC-type nitrate/sulfonate/bicarbonate transport system substrate-binding protein